MLGKIYKDFRNDHWSDEDYQATIDYAKARMVETYGEHWKDREYSSKEIMAIAVQMYQTVRALGMQIRSLGDYALELEDKLVEIERRVDDLQKDNRA